MRLFFGSHASLLAHFGSVDAQRLGDGRAEFRRLDEQCRERSDVVGTSPIGHTAQRVLMAPSRAQFQHDRAELLGKQRMRSRHFHSDARECGFETQVPLPRRRASDPAHPERR